MTTVTVVTPAGRSAVATLIVRGDAAVDIVSKRFEAAGPTAIAERAANSISFGTWIHRQSTAEDVVVAKRDPFTVEIHCHGGTAAVRSIVDSLIAAGCRESDWRQFSQDSSKSPIVHDATVALANASTEKVAAILLDQLRGSLCNETQEIIERLQNGEQNLAVEKLQQVRNRGDFGLHLTQPWKVVLAGPPNVGKSSLINALLGYQRAIVFDQPGTTRDLVVAETAINGWPVSLSDTAGIRDSRDDIERQGVRQTHSAAAAADLVILVRDSTQFGELKFDPGQLSSPPRTLTVHNKMDIATTDKDCDLRVSAVTKEG
ncbi:MAG: tRNA modification GTPase, partial [Pirellulaceae bacterium]